MWPGSVPVAVPETGGRGFLDCLTTSSNTGSPVWRLSSSFQHNCVLEVFVAFSNFKGAFLIFGSGSNVRVSRIGPLDMSTPFGIPEDYY